MRALKVNGGKPLAGTITPSGCKNAVLPILAATTLASGVFNIDNVPNITDVCFMVTLLKQLDVIVERVGEHTLRVDTRGMVNRPVVSAEARKMRASYYFMSTLLTRFGSAEVAFPGGCDFADRPIDQHLKAFDLLGAKEEERTETIPNMEATQTIITLTAENGLTAPNHGGTIALDIVSVGTTINAMMAAVLAEGTTTIKNAAREPHVVDCANFLNRMGAQVKGAGTDVIRITGVKELTATDYSVIPDQIEAGTFMVAAAATRGDVTISNIVVRHMDFLTDKLREMGIFVEVGEDWIRVVGKERPRATRIKTAPYPGYPTDMMPITMVLLCLCDGYSKATEGVYEARFRYTSELERMGAHIDLDNATATVKGMETLHSANIGGTDLRATAALTVAALTARGKSIVTGLEFMERGYEGIVSKLQSLGADVKVIDGDSENWIS